MLALGSRSDNRPEPEPLSSRVAFDEESSYWVGATTAAELLGVGRNQLVTAERIPFEVHIDGRRIYCREQLLTVANARDAPGTVARTVGGR
jgi:hypothetical protein